MASPEGNIQALHDVLTFGSKETIQYLLLSYNIDKLIKVCKWDKVEQLCLDTFSDKDFAKRYFAAHRDRILKKFKGIKDLLADTPSTNFFRKLLRYVDDEEFWNSISMKRKLSEDFIREFQDKVNWIRISVDQTLSEDFIREFQDRVLWEYILVKQKLSEDFIREFKDRIDRWDFISDHQILSEDFIREFQDEVSWYYISWNQTLSEDFIREFQDRVDWEQISEHQKLSEDFIREFKDRVDWKWITKRYGIKKKDMKTETNIVIPKNIPDIYDLINLETISAEDYLKQDKNNIIFVLGESSMGFDKKQLKRDVIDAGDFFYECKQSRGLRVGQDDVKGNKLALLRGQGNYFIKLGQLSKLLKSKKDKVYKLTPDRKLKNITHADAVDVGGMLNWKGRPIHLVSSWHCQEGTEAMLYNIEAM